jgi:hypothetical protein
VKTEVEWMHPAIVVGPVITIVLVVVAAIFILILLPRRLQEVGVVDFRLALLLKVQLAVTTIQPP